MLWLVTFLKDRKGSARWPVMRLPDTSRLSQELSPGLIPMLVSLVGERAGLVLNYGAWRPGSRSATVDVPSIDTLQGPLRRGTPRSAGSVWMPRKFLTRTVRLLRILNSWMFTHVPRAYRRADLRTYRPFLGLCETRHVAVMFEQHLERLPVRVVKQAGGREAVAQRPHFGPHLGVDLYAIVLF